MRGHDLAYGGDEPDPTPIYHRIYQALRRRIVGGEYALGSQLPTENALMKEFSVSRHTIRSAMQLLVSQGLLHRRAGLGTFVESAAERRHWASQSLDDVIESNSADRIVAEKLDFPASGSAAEAEARRCLQIDGPTARITWRGVSAAGPSALVTIYLPAALGRALPPDWVAQLGPRRLLHMVEQAAGTTAQRVQQRASATSATSPQARLLGAEPGMALLVLQRSYFDPSGNILQYSRVVARPDRREDVVELFRARR